MRGKRLIRRLLPVMMALTAAGVAFVPPLRRMAVGVAAPVLAAALGAKQGLADLIPLSVRERERLRSMEQRLAVMEAQVRAGRACREENRRLRRLLALPPPPHWRFIPARVVARDPFSWERRFRIGRGRSRGITVGAAVLVDGAVIGRVIELSAHSALVATLADPACRLSVRVPAADAVGVLRGEVRETRRGTPFLWIDYLPRDRPYAAGQAVVTTGLTGFEPPGLPVGRLAGPRDRTPAVIVRGLYARAPMRPDADFRWFRYVLVVVADHTAAR